MLFVVNEFKVILFLPIEPCVRVKDVPFTVLVFTWIKQFLAIFKTIKIIEL